jgi:hypothetical protein
MPGLRSKDRAMTKLTQSYVHGASTVRLIGETLGAYFDRAVARWRDELALVVRHQQVRWSYGELGQRVEISPPGCWPWASNPGTGSVSGRRTMRNG